jgi:UDP-glucose 4-epimerase
LKILVIGGAGYIGSVTARRLADSKHQVIVLDNMSRGHRDAVGSDITLYEGDFGDESLLDKIFQSELIEAVVHFGALSLVGESVVEPAKYFENNVARGITLLNSMVKNKVAHLVFSSTAAVYGEPETCPIDESSQLLPTNPYGESKLLFEKAMRWYASAYDFNYISLRYFNAAGSLGELGEDHGPETHLIPLVLQVAQGKRPSISIFGNDYKTEDGTCVRDYVHVADLADAHILALEQLVSGKIKSEVFNLGTSKGFSVLQIIESARRVTGHEIPVEVVPRRQGDPAALVASNEKCKRILGWCPRFENIDQIVADAWHWHKRHPDGYEVKESVLA